MRISGHECHGYVGLDIEDSAEVEQSVHQWRILLRSLTQKGDISNTGFSPCHLKPILDTDW
jgi:hypothetical protein